MEIAGLVRDAEDDNVKNLTVAGYIETRNIMGLIVLLQRWFMFLLLVICSFFDLEAKKVPKIILCIGLIEGIIFFLTFNLSNWRSILGGFFIGVMLLLFSKITEETIGYGDGIILCCTGIILGFISNLELFLIALFLSAIVSVILLWTYHFSKRKTIPFIPFLTVAYAIVCIQK